MYELLYIIPQNFTEKETGPIKDKVKKFIKDLEGEINKEEDSGLQRLAYSIRQVHRGYYILLHFDLDKEKLTNLNRDLSLTSEVLRYQIIKIPKGEWKVEKKKERTVREIRVEEKREEKEERPKKKVDLEELEKKIDKILKI